MLKDITIGQYMPGNSIVHRCDPRAKMLFTLLLLTVLFMIRGLVGFGIMLVFLGIVTMIAKIPLLYIVKGLKPMMYILLFTLVINVFFSRGETILWQWGWLQVSYEGILIAVRMGLRLVLLIMATSLLTLTTTPILITDGMERLLHPLKVIRLPVHEIAMMMSIALRFIPTLLEEADKIMKAQKARGANFDTGNVMQRAKSYLPILIPLIIGAFRRAEELALAMEARCYRGGEGRTKLRQLRYGGVDLVCAVVLLLYCGCVLLLDRLWIV